MQLFSLIGSFHLFRLIVFKQTERRTENTIHRAAWLQLKSIVYPRKYAHASCFSCFVVVRYHRGPFYKHGFTLLYHASLINNHIPRKVWDKITYPLPNFNGCNVEVWQWISNFIPHYIMVVITYPCWVSEWLNLTAFWGKADSEVHIVHISCVIVAYILESLSSLT